LKNLELISMSPSMSGKRPEVGEESYELANDIKYQRGEKEARQVKGKGRVE
jgi:hypothetical protein